MCDKICERRKWLNRSNDKGTWHFVASFNCVNDWISIPSFLQTDAECSSTCKHYLCNDGDQNHWRPCKFYAFGLNIYESHPFLLATVGLRDSGGHNCYYLFQLLVRATSQLNIVPSSGTSGIQQWCSVGFSLRLQSCEFYWLDRHSSCFFFLGYCFGCQIF